MNLLHGEEGRWAHFNCNALIMRLHTLAVHLIKRYEKSRNMDTLNLKSVMTQKSTSFSLVSWAHTAKSCTPLKQRTITEFSPISHLNGEIHTKRSQIVRFDEYSCKHTLNLYNFLRPKFKGCFKGKYTFKMYICIWALLWLANLRIVNKHWLNWHLRQNF